MNMWLTVPKWCLKEVILLPFSTLLWNYYSQDEWTGGHVKTQTKCGYFL